MIDFLMNEYFCWNKSGITINLNKSNNWLIFIDHLEALCSELPCIKYNKLSNSFETIYKLPVVGYIVFSSLSNSYDPYESSSITDNTNKVKKVNKNIAKFNSSQYFLWNSKYYDINYIYSYNPELSNIFKNFGHVVNPKVKFSGIKNIIEIKQCNFYNYKHHKQIHCNINHDTPQVRPGWIQLNELDYLEIKFLSPRLVTHIGTAGSYPTIDIFPKRRYIGRRKMRAYNAMNRDEKTSSYLKIIQNEESLSWVTEYELYYKHLVTNKWILAGVLIGNSNAMTEHVNDLYPYYNCNDGLLAQCIRIKPIQHHIRPCMRISIYGVIHILPSSHLSTTKNNNDIVVNDILNQSLIEYVVTNEDNHSKGKCRDSLKRFMYYKDSYKNHYKLRCKRKSEFRNTIKESLN